MCPVAAEEGVTGTWPVLSAATSSAPSSPPTATATATASLGSSIGHNSALLSHLSAAELRELDSEGRCVITDHGSFLLFNVYVPNAGEERNDFKLRFLELLSMRVRQCQAEGREVVVVGDLNIAATPLDHCAPEQYVLDDGSKVAFEESPSRQWWRGHVVDTMDTAAQHTRHTAAANQQTGQLVDVLRAEFPRQRNAYTCWNTLTGARAGNYGSRIDYILASLNVAAVTHSSRILAHVQGSDHCPVQCEMEAQRLPNWRVGSAPPALCSQWWPELSGQQKKLSSFFTRLATNPTVHQQPTESTQQPVEVSEQRTATALAAKAQVSTPIKRAVTTSLPAGRKRRKLLGSDSGQHAPAGASLLSYFSLPSKHTQSVSSAAVDIDKAFCTDAPHEQPPQQTSQSAPAATTSSPVSARPSAHDHSPVSDLSWGFVTADEQHSAASLSPSTALFQASAAPLASPHSHSHSPSPPPSDPPSPPPARAPTSPSHPSTPTTPPAAVSSSPDESSAATSSFSRLFTQSSLVVLCGHAIPARMYQVNKKGPNHGRQFYCCSRPPPGRCDFWRWLSDVKRDRSRQQQRSTAPQHAAEFVTARSMQAEPG